MSPEKLIDCPVQVDPELALGVYVNAFRVLHGQGDERILDFLLYSDVEGFAELVSRVRVHQELLVDMHEHLGAYVIEASDEGRLSPN